MSFGWRVDKPDYPDNHILFSEKKKWSQWSSTCLAHMRPWGNREGVVLNATVDFLFVSVFALWQGLSLFSSSWTSGLQSAHTLGYMEALVPPLKHCESLMNVFLKVQAG